MGHLKATVTEVSRNFSDYINRVAFGHDTFTLLLAGKPLARLTPCRAGKIMADLPDLLGKLPKLALEDLSAFERDLRGLRQSMPMEENNAWDA